MTSRKRWHEVYEGENPLALPQQIARGIHDCMGTPLETQSDPLKYVWIYIARQPDGNGHAPAPGTAPYLDAGDWLNVVDESASLGAETVIISLEAPLAEHPEVWEICEWAQGAHDMGVGIHIRQERLSEAEQTRFKALDAKRTWLFADGTVIESLRAIEAEGIQVYLADTHEHGEVHKACCLPRAITCIGPGGAMYTCGLVLGNEAFRLGNYAERPLRDIMDDEAVPHEIPDGLRRPFRSCCGCPPLLYKRMQQVQ